MLQFIDDQILLFLNVASYVPGKCSPAAKSSAAAVGETAEYEEEFPELSARLSNFNLEPTAGSQQAAF